MTKKVKKETSIVILKASSVIGKLGTLANVKSGYARNFLIPNKIATLATPSKIKFFQMKQKEVEKIERLNFEKFLNIKNELEKQEAFVIKKRVNDNDVIFGTITKKNILELLKKQVNIKLESTMFNLPKIDHLGKYTVPIQLTPTLNTNITINIIGQ